MNISRRLTRVAVCLILACTTASTPADESSAKEAEFLAVLTSDAPAAQKAMACKHLAIHGSAVTVPELAKLLPDPQLSSWARIALEAIPGDASSKALRDAAGSLDGLLLVGVINSIGVRQDAEAVALLVGRLNGEDAQAASASAAALGHIGNDDSTQALRSALATAPEDVRSAVAEGCVLCAERLLVGGDAATATEIYDEVRKADVPLQRIIEGTRGAILARGEGGIALLMEAFQSDDKKMFQLALGTVREFPGAAVDKALAAEMQTAAPDRAALIVQAMADRTETVDVAVVLKAAESGETVVRLSAINALQRVGNGQCLSTLLDIAVGSDAELAQAAQETLAVLPGQSVDGDIGILAASEKGERQRIVLQLIGQRRIVGEVGLLENELDASNDAAIRSAALYALGETVSLQKLPILIKHVVRPAHAEDAEAAQRALKAACVRMPDRDACAELLSTELFKAVAPSATKTTLLEILYAVGGTTALKTLGTAAMDQDDQLQNKSSELLGKWNGVEAAPVLLDLAKNAPAEKYRVRAVRGYIGIARKFAMSNKERTDMCRNALNATNRTTEHKLVIDVLKLHPSVEGLELAVRLTKIASVKADASAAALAIAAEVGGKGVDVAQLMAGIDLEQVELKIVKAQYGAGSMQKDVTAVLQQQAGDRPLIVLPSGNYNGTFGGDPAPGVAKKLKVEYVMNGKSGVAAFDENALIILPMPK